MFLGLCSVRTITQIAFFYTIIVIVVAIAGVMVVFEDKFFSFISPSEFLLLFL